MQDPKNQSPNSDIQPISFSNLLWLFFNAVLQFLRHLILFFNKNKVFLLIFLLLGFAIGIFINKLAKTHYTVSMMVRHTELNARTFGRMIEDLDKMASSGSNQALSRSLNLPVPVAKEIIAVKGRNMDGLALEKDTSQQNNRTFLIDLTITDENIATPLSKGVIGYFNNNPYLSKLKKDKIQLYNDRLKFINHELQKLDSLKMVYNKFLVSAGSSSMFYNNAFNPVDLYKQSDDYQKEKERIEEWLKQSNQSIINIDSTMPVAIPNSMGLISYILLYGLLFLALGVLIAAIKVVVKAG